VENEFNIRVQIHSAILEHLEDHGLCTRMRSKFQRVRLVHGGVPKYEQRFQSMAALSIMCTDGGEEWWHVLGLVVLLAGVSIWPFE
jgi:hypothetical protein